LRARLKDIADEVGVRPSTVSLTLNKHPKALTFSLETRQKIKEVAERMGYIPNAAARALVTNRTFNIGFIIPEYASQRWSNQFYSDMLNGIDETCYKNNYSLFVHCCNLNNALDFVFPRGISERNVEGLIISNAISPEVLKRFEELKIPCVRIGAPGNPSKSAIPEFSPDLPMGYMMALEHLSELGHNKVAVFDSGSKHSKYLSEELKKRLKKSKLSEKMELTYLFTGNGKCDEHSASEFINKYLKIDKSERPSAVITNPQTCLGIFNGLRKNNLNCPEDLSIISNYQYNLFELIAPGITSLEYDNSYLASQATKELLDMIDEKQRKRTGKPKMDLPIKLAVRQSCKKIS
jgi:DNA-binding LacI/PurR family transcriptional regulator